MKCSPTLALTATGWLLLSCLWIGCEPSPRQAPLILPTMTWVEDGETEVTAYLQALQAESVSLGSSSDFPAEDTADAEPSIEPGSLMLSIRNSKVLAYKTPAEQQAVLDHLALVIVDNLAYPAAYEQLVIDVRASDGRLMLRDTPSVAEIRRRRPRLRQAGR
jgi:hypothetical protein